MIMPIHSLFVIRNYSVKKMPLPVVDITAAMKVNAEKTENAILKVRISSLSGVTGRYKVIKLQKCSGIHLSTLIVHVV